MKLVLLFGPQAVGKMTVGQELANITHLKLFHNHMTIELLEPLYGFTSELWRLSQLFREEIFKSFSQTNEYGMIFTYVWAFDQKDDWHFVKSLYDMFKSQKADVFFVELEANIEERLKRNNTPNRLEQKPTKRNITQSENNLLSSLNKHRLNSETGELNYENYLRINNTHMDASTVANMIKDKFQL